MARTRKTLGVGEVASGVVRRADKTGRRHGAAAVSAWRDVVGSDIAQHTRGFALRNKRELVVFVDSAAWANQLTLMSGELVGRLNSHLGEKAVSNLRFTVSRKVKDELVWEADIGDADEFYAPDTVSPVPLNQTEIQQLEHVASTIKNPDLRGIVLRVMTKDMELKKGARSQAEREPRNDPSKGTQNQGL